MKDTVTLKELAAILVRRAKLIVVLMLVFAMLLGGWKAVDLQNAEMDHNEALTAYQSKKAALEAELQYCLHQQSYMQESLLMQIDPFNKVVTTIGIFIDEKGELSETMVSRLTGQYLQLWDTADLQKALSHEAEDVYLREVLSLEGAEGGLLSLVAWGADEEEAQHLAEDAIAYLLTLQKEVSSVSENHELVRYEYATSIEADSTLAKQQITAREKNETYAEEIAEVQQELDALTEPVMKTVPTFSQVIKSAVKYAVLGTVLGTVLGMAWVIISYLFCNKMESSHHLAQRLSIPMLGTVAKPRDYLSRIANRILGEREWKDESQALVYLAARAEAHLPKGCPVALLSTLSVNGEDAQVQSVINVLNKQGFSACFAADASHSVEAVRAIRESVCVVLVERCGASDWEAIFETAALAESMETPVCGFVLI